MSAAELAPRRHDSIDGVLEPAENPLLVGHRNVRHNLAKAFREGRLHHALLLAGPSGIGKATLAFHLARHVLTGAEQVPADDLQPSDEGSQLFRTVAQGSHAAVLHLTRPANERTKGFKTVVTVDEIRRVGKLLSLSAHDGGYRVVIVDPADDLNASAANALLKNLEEPPARTLFVLITHVPGRLMPTIRSRCQFIRLNPLADAEVAEAMTGLGLALPDSARDREALLQRAGGSVRDAILLTEYGGLEIANTIDTILQGKAFDLALASRLADAVTARDATIQFDMFNEHLLGAVSAAAARAAADSDTANAAGRAGMWGQLRDDIAATETYNLDKRHHVMTTLRKSYDSLHK
ncbi:DNA polymerase III subunit delta' [Mesorhizobium sp. Z1-4]|uniref:DNA polymerase III subunit delta' n=1 Tax=Mesorhizobium sp. Z1-4 TaxID=2448478 RepID=UPI000FDA79B0|nr:DNA polymerase III subunit delta' [Mesorhizobium sp. Z1-4]